MESARSQDTHRIARKPLPASAQRPQPPTQAQAPADPATHEENLKFPPLNHQSAGQNKENIPIAEEAAGPTNPFVHPTAMPAPLTPATVADPRAPIPRKAMGPRQMPGAPPSPSSDMPHPPPEASNPSTPPTPEKACPVLPQRPALQTLHFDDARRPQSLDEARVPDTHTPQLRSPLSPSRSPSPWSRQSQKPFTPFTLTIIRRDPGTGHQWNIGKVTSFQSNILYHDPNNPEAEPMVQYPKGYPAINIHIETSGYARFRDFPTILPKIEGRPGSAGGASNLAQNMKELAAAMKNQSDATAAAQHANGQYDDDEGGFKRQVVMTYGKSWAHNIREAFKGKNGGNRSRSSTTTSGGNTDAESPLVPPRSGFHRRQDSGTSSNSNDSTFHHEAPFTGYSPPPAAIANNSHAPVPTPAAMTTGDDQPVLTVLGPGLRPKGYSFLSPWDGTCDFRTSSSGRALKCRHTRNTTTQGFNPLAAAQALRDAASAGVGGGNGRSRGMSTTGGGGGGDTGRTVPVSELRFNLPPTDLFHSREDRERAAREVVEGLGRMIVRSPGGHERGGADDLGDEDDEPVFDFSGLGRERAGGGSRGKRAKLGKLLVHDEGLKMLDLVIAANMGIWWQAWERTF